MEIRMLIFHCFIILRGSFYISTYYQELKYFMIKATFGPNNNQVHRSMDKLQFMIHQVKHHQKNSFSSFLESKSPKNVLE